MSAEKFKVVLLGEGRVGKTSILVRYINNEFTEGQTSTKNASFMDKTVTVSGQRVELNIWDTAGQEQYHALAAIYYRGANGALLVYDITDTLSFDRVKNWVKELRKVVGNDIIIVIAGNKIDLERHRCVNEAEVLSYAQSVGATHYYTSAKVNRGLDEVFNNLAQRMLEKKGSTPANGSATTRKKLVIVDTPPEPTKQSGGCC